MRWGKSLVKVRGVRRKCSRLPNWGVQWKVINIIITDAGGRTGCLPAQLSLEFIVGRLHFVHSFLYGEFHGSGLFVRLGV